jgi:hypothetical protein
MRSTEVIGARLPRSTADALKQSAVEANTSAGAIVRAALDAFKIPEVRAAVAKLDPSLRAALRPVTATSGGTRAPAKRSPSASATLTRAHADALRPIAKRLGITHEAAIGAALSLMGSLERPVSTVTPAVRAAILPVIAPTLRASASTGKQYNKPVERREIISDTCDLENDCGDDELIDAVREINRQAAAESANEPEKKGEPPPEPAPERLRRGSLANSSTTAKRSAPAKSQPTTTRETLCQHLRLSTKAYGGEIRRKAEAIASGSRLMNSNPQAAAALRKHLGLETHCTDDRVMAIVWSLTAEPSTAPNPYLKRLARK